MKIADIIAARAAAQTAEVTPAPKVFRKARPSRTQKRAADALANDFIDDMVEEPSLDAFFDRDPVTLSDDDIYQLVTLERQRRAAFMDKGDN